MVTIVPLFAALLVSVSAPAPLSPVAAQPAATSSGATRFDGASATATVTARIISASASIGAGYGPPAPLMSARRTTVTAADGGAVPALVYDFE